MTTDRMARLLARVVDWLEEKPGSGFEATVRGSGTFACRDVVVGSPRTGWSRADAVERSATGVVTLACHDGRVVDVAPGDLAAIASGRPTGFELHDAARIERWAPDVVAHLDGRLGVASRLEAHAMLAMSERARWGGPDGGAASRGWDQDRLWKTMRDKGASWEDLVTVARALLAGTPFERTRLSVGEAWGMCESEAKRCVRDARARKELVEGTLGGTGRDLRDLRDGIGDDGIQGLLREASERMVEATTGTVATR